MTSLTIGFRIMKHWSIFRSFVDSEVITVSCPTSVQFLQLVIDMKYNFHIILYSL